MCVFSKKIYKKQLNFALYYILKLIIILLRENIRIQNCPKTKGNKSKQREKGHV